jgi:predicted nucleic acid-binding protein
VVFYIDTSALAKLVVSEAETAGLLAWYRQASAVVSSELAVTELLRAVARAAPERLPAARARLSEIDLIPQSRAILDAAGLLEPRALRTLDAIHLATAAALGSDLAGVVTYDHRLAAAATSLEFNPISPA